MHEKYSKKECRLYCIKNIAEGKYQPFAQIGVLRKLPIWTNGWYLPSAQDTDLGELLVLTFRYKNILNT